MSLRVYSEMKNYTPTSGKAELHITYECDLACVNCNRFSFLRSPHTPPMTVADVKDFFRQCRELNFDPDIVIIGGEPTLHPDLIEILTLSREFKGNGLVQMWTNSYSQHAKDLIPFLRDKLGISIPADTFKEKSKVLSVDDIYVSPKDFGITRAKCWQHGSEICGIAVDSLGYSLCATGGALDSVLKLNIRTKNLADLFNNKWAAENTERMCEHCGNCLSQILVEDEKKKWRNIVESQKRKYGAYMSTTWLNATEGMK